VKFLKKLYNEELGVFIGIPSKSRPFRVKEQEKLMGCKPTWFVPKEEVKQYEDEGAIVIPCETGLSVQRNMILEESFKNNQTCLMLDDDLKGFKEIISKNPTPITKDVSLNYVVEELKNNINIFKIAGNSSVSNLFWYNPGSRISIKGLLVALFLVKPSTPRFDVNLNISEDTDFSIQHYVKYGGVVKLNYLRNYFNMVKIDRDNMKFKKPIEGGIDWNKDDFPNSYNYLMKKWSGVLRPSKTQYEVIIK